MIRWWNLWWHCIGKRVRWWPHRFSACCQTFASQYFFQTIYILNPLVYTTKLTSLITFFKRLQRQGDRDAERQREGPQLLLSRPFQHRLEAPDARLHGAGRRSLAGTPVQGPTGKSQGQRMRRSRNRSKGSRSSRQRIWRAKEAPRGPPLWIVAKGEEAQAPPKPTQVQPGVEGALGLPPDGGRAGDC